MSRKGKLDKCMNETYEYNMPPEVNIHSPDEVDKSKTINEMTFQELMALRRRLGLELDIEQLIMNLNRNNQGNDFGYDGHLKVNASTPITELYHHGIPGQKWGERRYQNEDGSLTEEGRRLYG